MLKFTNYLTAGLAAIMLAVAPAAYSMSMSKASAAKLEAVQATKQARMRVLIQQGLSKLRADDYPGAEEEFAFVAADADFPLLSPEQKQWLYCLLASAQSGRSEYDQAYASLKLAAEANPDTKSEYYWYMLWDLGTRTKKYGDAIDAMTALAVASPEDISRYSLSYVFQTVRNAENLPDGQAHREKALMALWTAKYKPEGTGSAEGLWFSLFEIKAEKGDTAFAQDLVKTFRYAATYIGLRVDKRYRSYSEADPAHFNLKTLLDGQVDDSRAQATANPRQLEAAVALMLDLIEDDRATEALKLADDTIARAEAAPAGKPLYDDMDDQWEWLLNTRTRALARLGRDAESEAAQIKARDEALAKKKDTVSQRINLGDFYYEHGRPQEALAQVNNILAKDDAAKSDSSPYGLMAAEEVRACAYAQLNDQAHLAKSLDYIRAHAEDGYGPARSALLCAGDLDGLAAITLARLNDPLHRNGTLRVWQTYRPDAYPTAIDKQISQTAAAFMARADVKAAMERYGYIDSYDVQASGN